MQLGEAIEQSRFSVDRAITTLQRQRATLRLLSWRARERETPEQHALLVEKTMRRIFAREAEDAAIAQENEGGAA